MTARPAHPLRRALDWYFGDPGRRAFVWVVWAAMVGIAGGFVWEYGRNLPANDEWAFVPDVFASPAHQLGWLFDRHCDHRYPLARAVWLACLHLGGYDFRVPMWVSLAAVAAAAGCLIAAARTFRGRTEYTDCLYPVLLLHRGHCENLLMGYQLAFTLSVLGLCGFLLAVAKSRTRPRLLAAAGCAAVVAVGGGIGAVFAPLLCGWVLWQAWRTGRGLVARALAVAVLGYTGWATQDALRNPNAEPKNPLTKAVAVACRTAESSLGQELASDDGVYGWAVLAAAGLLAGWLIWLARRPADRPCALGLLAVLVGTGGFVAAIGLSRGNGHAHRFTAFTQFLPVVGLLAAARFLPRRTPLVWTAATLTAIAAVLIVRQSWGEARDYAQRYVNEYEAAERDAAAGVPIDLLAERNVDYFSPAFGVYWRTFWDRGVGPAAPAPPPRAFRTEPTTFRRIPALDPRLRPSEAAHQYYAVAVPDGRYVAAVRVRFARPDLAQSNTFRFHWITVEPDGGERVHFEPLHAWLRPGEATTLLWIDGRVRGVWLESGAPDWKIELRSMELLFPATDGP